MYYNCFFFAQVEIFFNMRNDNLDAHIEIYFQHAQCKVFTAYVENKFSTCAIYKFEKNGSLGEALIVASNKNFNKKENKFTNKIDFVSK